MSASVPVDRECLYIIALYKHVVSPSKDDVPAETGHSRGNSEDLGHRRGHFRGILTGDFHRSGHLLEVRDWTQHAGIWGVRVISQVPLPCRLAALLPF